MTLPIILSPNLVRKCLQFLSDKNGPKEAGLGLVRGNKPQILPSLSCSNPWGLVWGGMGHSTYTLHGPMTGPST